jgi:hypothetical protein
VETFEMTDQLQALRDDIGFLRELAEVGRSPQLQEGATLIAAGAIFSLASLGQWAVVGGLLPRLSPWISPGIWSAAMVAFVSALIVLRRVMDGRTSEAGAKGMKLAWQGVGWTIFTLFACAQIIAWRTQSYFPLLMLPSAILALYGLGWMVAAGLTRKTWVWTTAIGAFVAALGVAALCQSPALFLVFAAALVLLAMIPGLIMVRQAAA